MALSLNLGRLPARETKDIEEVEIQLLLEGVSRVKGLELSDYAAGSLRRRIRLFMQEQNLRSVSAVQEKVFHHPASMERFLSAIFVSATSMFRDPGFFLAFRSLVVPELRLLSGVRIWHAGCSTGEEVYSMAILLEEEGLYDRCRLYATDVSESSLARARSGSLPLRTMKENTSQYLKSGGKRAFSEYYSARGRREDGPGGRWEEECVVMRPSLKRNVVFAQHNLATDRSFNEFQAVICRNVLIYFNKSLQTRAHRVIHQSLAQGGFLGLGNHESIRFSMHEDCYQPLAARDKLYRKVR